MYAVNIFNENIQMIRKLSSVSFGNFHPFHSETFIKKNHRGNKESSIWHVSIAHQLRQRVHRLLLPLLGAPDVAFEGGVYAGVAEQDVQPCLDFWIDYISAYMRVSESWSIREHLEIALFGDRSDVLSDGEYNGSHMYAMGFTA